MRDEERGNTTACSLVTGLAFHRRIRVGNTAEIYMYVQCSTLGRRDEDVIQHVYVYSVWSPGGEEERKKQRRAKVIKKKKGGG